MGGRLHGHQLLHVKRAALPIIERWADRWDDRRSEPGESVERHARPAVPSDLAYATKEHRFAGPYERFRQFHQRSEPIVGQRVSFTKRAQKIIADAERLEPLAIAA